jgi:hypothetical protein
MSDNLEIKRRSLTILSRARALIAKGWCQHGGAVNAQGDYVQEDSPDAVAFCAIGAVSRAQHDLGLENGWLKALDELNTTIGDGVWIGDWNDTSDQVIVLEGFDLAIARLQLETQQEPTNV